MSFSPIWMSPNWTKCRRDENRCAQFFFARIGGKNCWREINREKEDRQVYWVCPIIEQSEKSDMQAAMELQKEVAAEFQRCPPTHSRQNEKRGQAENYGRFRSGKIRLLIATNGGGSGRRRPRRRCDCKLSIRSDSAFRNCINCGGESDGAEEAAGARFYFTSRFPKTPASD